MRTIWVCIIIVFLILFLVGDNYEYHVGYNYEYHHSSASIVTETTVILGFEPSALFVSVDENGGEEFFDDQRMLDLMLRVINNIRDQNHRELLLSWYDQVYLAPDDEDRNFYVMLMDQLPEGLIPEAFPNVPMASTYNIPKDDTFVLWWAPEWVFGLEEQQEWLDEASTILIHESVHLQDYMMGRNVYRKEVASWGKLTDEMFTDEHKNTVFWQSVCENVATEIRAADVSFRYQEQYGMVHDKSEAYQVWKGPTDEFWAYVYDMVAPLTLRRVERFDESQAKAFVLHELTKNLSRADN